MQLKNLAKDYVKNELVRKLFKYLKFLPFVPVKDVIKAFKKIKQLGSDCDKFQPMFVYFERVYIGNLLKNSSTIRKVPMYPIKTWNVVIRINKDKGKTNNNLESWHKVFAWDAKIHPTFTKLVEQFRVEQQNTEVILAQIKSGDKYTINKNQLKKDEAVKQLISDYSFDRLFDYFDRLILVLDS
jgi:hypothetical protein